MRIKSSTSMNNTISICSSAYDTPTHCQLTSTCKGWGCRFLGTPIDEMPMTDHDKAKLFSKVYREAKTKGVLECPHYRPLFIDEVLTNINPK